VGDGGAGVGRAGAAGRGGGEPAAQLQGRGSGGGRPRRVGAAARRVGREAAAPYPAETLPQRPRWVPARVGGQAHPVRFAGVEKKPTAAAARRRKASAAAGAASRPRST